MTLIPRKPAIASDKALLNWSPVPEFAHINNGASVLIPYVEHYLNNVMNEVRTLHCGNDPALAEEIGLFIRQEATHARYHLAFNKQMFEKGYEGLKPLIERTVRHLQSMRSKRSLAFNVAYCAGFETTATFSAKYALEACTAYFKGADSYGANLFQWHVAEEFEHRATCHRAFEAVSGRYVIRMTGLIYSFWHINKIFTEAADIVFAEYRKGMTATERRHSVRVQKRLIRRQFAYLLPRMIRLISPFYDPAKLKVTPPIKAALAFFQASDPISSSFANLNGEYAPPQTSI